MDFWHPSCCYGIIALTRIEIDKRFAGMNYEIQEDKRFSL